MKLKESKGKVSEKNKVKGNKNRHQNNKNRRVKKNKETKTNRNREGGLETNRSETQRAAGGKTDCSTAQMMRQFSCQFSFTLPTCNKSCVKLCSHSLEGM